jgi:hypothetical protein
MIRSTHAQNGGAQTGSAYIAVLLVLVVLTILGLALSFVTQTEMQAGSNERSISRVFYAADSGIEAATARGILGDTRATTFYLTDSGLALAVGTLDLGTQVDVSAFFPIHSQDCNFCEINMHHDGSPGYTRTVFTVTAKATRFATVTAGTERNPIAQKLLGAMMDIQPIQVTNEVQDGPNDQESALQEVSF